MPPAWLRMCGAHSHLLMTTRRVVEGPREARRNAAIGEKRDSPHFSSLRTHDNAHS